MRKLFEGLVQIYNSVIFLNWTITSFGEADFLEAWMESCIFLYEGLYLPKLYQYAILDLISCCPFVKTGESLAIFSLEIY